MAVIICAIVTLVIFVLLSLDVLGYLSERADKALRVLSMIVFPIDVIVLVVSFIIEVV